MLEPVRVVPAAPARRGSSQVVIAAAAASLLAAVGCSTDLRPTSGTANLDAQPSATLSSRSPCFIRAIDGKELGNFFTSGYPHRYVVAPGIHVIQIDYNDGQKYSTVRAEVSLVVTKGHIYHAEGWPPVFYDDATGQRAQQSLRGVAR